MNGRHRVLIAIVLAIGIVTVVGLWNLSKPPRIPVAYSPDTLNDQVGDKKYVLVGGVKRARADIAKRDHSALHQAASQAHRDFMSRVGRSVPIRKDANPMVKSVAEALETNRYPERLTALIEPKPFDKDAYAANPQAYLDVVEPGRVFQPAQPGPEVPRIVRESPRYVEIPQKETVSLKVKSVPHAPVTFTSFDLGAFQNQLASITVESGDDGVAIARFTGTPGTYNNVSILAASPVTSGSVAFHVNVKVP